MSKKNWKVTTKMPELPDLDEGERLLDMFDQQNADINLLNLVDEEMIRLGGSKMYFYKYYQTQDYNPEFIHADMAGKTSTKRWWQIWKR